MVGQNWTTYSITICLHSYIQLFIRMITNGYHQPIEVSLSIVVILVGLLQWWIRTFKTQNRYSGVDILQFMQFHHVMLQTKKFRNLYICVYICHTNLGTVQSLIGMYKNSITSLPLYYWNAGMVNTFQQYAVV